MRYLNSLKIKDAINQEYTEEDIVENENLKFEYVHCADLEDFQENAGAGMYWVDDEGNDIYKVLVEINDEEVYVNLRYDEKGELRAEF